MLSCEKINDMFVYKVYCLNLKTHQCSKHVDANKIVSFYFKLNK